MAKIFITGSADGLGLLAARNLIADGHEVIVHARNEQRGKDALKQLPGAAKLLTGDLSDLAQIKALAQQANAYGKFDAVIHNAGVYRVDMQQLLFVNTLAPFMLTGLMHLPERLIYLSSGMHFSGNAKWSDHPAYSDTKLHVLIMAKIISRKYPNIFANAVDPGWVPTKMGGSGAPDDLSKGYETQTWLAQSNEPDALVSGQYFYHKQVAAHHPAADHLNAQQDLIDNCEKLTGIKWS